LFSWRLNASFCKSTCRYRFAGLIHSPENDIFTAIRIGRIEANTTTGGRSMLHRPGGNQRTLSSLSKVAKHYGLAVLGTSLLIVLMAAGGPAAAQRVVGFAEARSRGAGFEVIENPNNCIVKFLPDPAGQASGIVEIDCGNSGVDSHVKVRLFSRYFLNSPWKVTTVEFVPPPPEVSIIHRPIDDNLLTELEVSVFARGRAVRKMTITASPGLLQTPICPREGFLPTAYRNMMGAQELGWDKSFKVRWEAGSQNNPARRCHDSFDNGRTPAESVVPVLNCSRRLNGAQASFDMFEGLTLNTPWVVDTASVAPFQLGASSNATALTVPAAGSNAIFTRVRLGVTRGQQARAAVSIRIKPVLADPLPNCLRIGPAGPPVCSTTADCPQTRGGGPLGGFVFGPSKCSAACGNRCVNL
jgi:hypothetical protein